MVRVRVNLPFSPVFGEEDEWTLCVYFGNLRLMESFLSRTWEILVKRPILLWSINREEMVAEKAESQGNEGSEAVYCVSLNTK